MIHDPTGVYNHHCCLVIQAHFNECQYFLLTSFNIEKNRINDRRVAALYEKNKPETNTDGNLIEITEELKRLFFKLQ